MPTPNIMRSRSPVSVSQSCLPQLDDAQVHSRHFHISGLAASIGADDALSKLSGQDGSTLATGADVDLTASTRCDPMDTDIDNRSPSPSVQSSTDSESDVSLPSASSSPSPLSLQTTPSIPHAQITKSITDPASKAAKSIEKPSQNKSSSSSSSSTSPPQAHSEWEFTSRRIRPSIPSSLFRPFARFVGTQKSDRQNYKVEVEMKYVDVENSFCCGFLKIEGLTVNLPSITTYFEGEIVGSKYGFNTQHPSWGACEKVDLAHWSRFPAFAPFKSAVKAGHFYDHDSASRDYLFMRWKELFLVPNHKQRSLDGASFEGFYYIAFDKRSGSISGIYFHNKSEKFQQLELTFQREPYCFPAIEFR